MNICRSILLHGGIPGFPCLMFLAYAFIPGGIEAFFGRILPFGRFTYLQWLLVALAVAAAVFFTARLRRSALYKVAVIAASYVSAVMVTNAAGLFLMRFLNP